MNECAKGSIERRNNITPFRAPAVLKKDLYNRLHLAIESCRLLISVSILQKVWKCVKPSSQILNQTNKRRYFYLKQRQMAVGAFSNHDTPCR